MEEQQVHIFIDLETGEEVLVLLTDEEFFEYLRQTFGGFQMDDEEG